MKPGLVPGSRVELSVTVTADMCPHFDGRLHHPVCATWTLVNHMEVAGRRLLEPFLETHEEGVGAHISIDHRSPAPIGANIVICAEVESCAHNRLTTKMYASCGERLLATGKFVQVILEKSRLAAILEQARRQLQISSDA
jgi:fluoroacetyl-CoA thioesterase